MAHAYPAARLLGDLRHWANALPVPAGFTKEGLRACSKESKVPVVAVSVSIYMG
jgi:hypothetical protein